MTFDPNQPRDENGRWTRLAGLLSTGGGFTHNLGLDAEDATGFAVATEGNEVVYGGHATSDDIEAYVKDHLAALDNPRSRLGAWFNSEDGKSYLDVSHVHTSFAEALEQARKDKQIALFDLGTGVEYHTFREDWQPVLDGMKGTDLDGLPQKPTNVPGHGSFTFHSNKDIQAVATAYNAKHGLGAHPRDYSPIDPERAARVAAAFTDMKHDPDDPEVAEAYAALKRETLAQYEALTAAGYKYHFYPEGGDPYANTPREAIYDLTHHKKMFVYPTIGPDGGFGEDAALYPGHPLLEVVPGLTWDGKPVTYNDVFRGVHDSMAHAKEGLGFGPRGEDNAYRQHYAMFSRKARRALASETRGQNTWVNYGPYGEQNRADPRNTQYAPQKAGLLPEWATDPDYFKGNVMSDLSIYTPDYAGTYDLAVEDGKLAFWKQILPKKQIHYTAKNGQRGVLNFDDRYLTDLATNAAVDQVGFLLADTDNRHTMDPERFRGSVVEWKIRDDLPNPDHNGLWGKIVFPNRDAAKAVLDNPDLGVSARIREGIERSDGSTVSRGIVHVLGTLDPQVSGMSGWQTADLSNEDDMLDLTDASYENGTPMPENTKSVTEYTEAEIEAMTEEELEAFLAAAETEFAGILDEIEAEVLDEDQEVEEPVLVSLSNEAKSEIDLANSRASRALTELARARWDKTRDSYLSAGVPPALLDLAEPIFNRPSDFIVDLSNEGADGEIHVGEIVAKLLDAAKGTIDLSNEVGHGGTFKQGDGEDPDKSALDLWDSQA